MSELQHQVDAETIITAEPFNNLLNLAVESCFKSPELYHRKLDEIRGREIPIDPAIERIGLWGVRQAIEEVINLQDVNTLEYDHNPEGPYLKPDKNVQDRIEAIGTALLEEAFTCLGEDAPEMARQFKDAASWQEKSKVCTWLRNRIEQIREAAPDFEEADLYHPLRLSPVAIGSYPEIHCDTTCLGYSILMSSFFEKAGAKYMHFGVATTAGDEARRAQNHMMDFILRATKEMETKLPPHLIETFVKAAVENIKAIGEHTGFHAAVAVELDDDVWYQLDPNYRSHYLMEPSLSKKYAKTYDILKDLESRGVRGVETMMVHRAGLYPHYFNAAPLTAAIETCLLPEEAEEYLKGMDPELARGEIIDALYYHLFNPPEDNRDELFIQDMIKGYCDYFGMDYYHYMQEIISDTIDEYVFPDADDGDIRKCIERCKWDPAYLKRRGEDLHLASFMVVLKLQGEFGNDVISGDLGVPHGVVEVGLPKYRVGATVLSDFATLCGDELPPSFWMAHWPSQISFAEHSELGLSDAQDKVLTDKADLINETELRYRTFDSIIKAILEQGELNGHRRQSGPDRQEHPGVVHPDAQDRADRSLPVA